MKYILFTLTVLILATKSYCNGFGISVDDLKNLNSNEILNYVRSGKLTNSDLQTLSYDMDAEADLNRERCSNSFSNRGKRAQSCKQLMIDINSIKYNTISSLINNSIKELEDKYGDSLDNKPFFYYTDLRNNAYCESKGTKLYASGTKSMCIPLSDYNKINDLDGQLSQAGLTQEKEFDSWENLDKYTETLSDRYSFSTISEGKCKKQLEMSYLKDINKCVTKREADEFKYKKNKTAKPTIITEKPPVKDESNGCSVQTLSYLATLTCCKKNVTSTGKQDKELCSCLKSSSKWYYTFLKAGYCGGLGQELGL